jgi:hypothetical protein
MANRTPLDEPSERNQCFRLSRLRIVAASANNSAQPVTVAIKGSVAISDCGQKDLSAVRIRLCGEPLELLSE